MAKEEVPMTPEYKDAIDAVEKTGGRMNARELNLYRLAIVSSSELFLDVLNQHINAAREKRLALEAKFTQQVDALQAKILEHERRLDANKRHIGNLESKLAKLREREQ